MEKCMVCGKEHNDGRLHLPVLHGMCFYCSFWYRILKGRRPYIVVGGECFVTAPEDGEGPRGHGGRTFVIKHADGRITTSTNLWSKGKLDAKLDREFLRFFPDNAEFILQNITPIVDGIPF